MSDLSSEPIQFPRPRRPRVKKRRLLVILLPLGVLAIISTVFGMMMAVAADLPQLENRQEFKGARNSILTDVHGKTLGVLTGNQNRIILTGPQISQWMRFAIISIEDRRFYANQGVDVRGVARAFVADLLHQGARQGGSTITQQFVKNALQAQSRRTVFEKLREAALAYHLTRKWSKDKVLNEYLNSIYFGNGAYGIESAARTYFGQDPNHLGCGTLTRPCAKELTPPEAALLAGIVASPSGYDPVTHPTRAKRRRYLVLHNMLEQHFIDQAQFAEYTATALPPASQVQPPREHAPTPSTPYFTTWVRQQLVDRFGPQRAFQGGLRVKTTLDLQFQLAAEAAVQRQLAWTGGPTASLVAIDNATGEVRAMVGGRDYNEAPFNLATQGQRQPGSAFKPFVLAQALREGVSPTSLWTSAKRVFTVPGTHGREHFVVNNYAGEYAGTTTLANALTHSDNSVFAALGIKVGTARVARLAERMGIRTPVSHNYAVALGGLRQGVTPLDMAHAYETIVRGGRVTTGTLGAPHNGPVGVREVDFPSGHKPERNERRLVPVLPRAVADTTANLMTSVVRAGTGTAAQLPNEWVAGKTGTTENYGDAWFVGFTKRYTVAVWVGYPNRLKAMKTEFHGGPVAGGTFPALIWHDFMTSVEAINQQRAAEYALQHHKPVPVITTPSTPAPAPVVSTTPTSTPAPTATTPSAPAPSRKPAPAKAAPTPAAPPPSSGGGGTGGAGAGGAGAPSG